MGEHEKRIEELSQDENIRFVATVDKQTNFYLPKGTITFDYVLVDVGANFDKAAGEFTAPKPGKYLFMVDGQTNSFGVYADVYLEVNGLTVKGVIEKVELITAINGVVVTELKTGDIVRLNNAHANTINGYSSFP